MVIHCGTGARSGFVAFPHFAILQSAKSAEAGQHAYWNVKTRLTGWKTFYSKKNNSRTHKSTFENIKTNKIAKKRKCKKEF